MLARGVRPCAASRALRLARLLRETGSVAEHCSCGALLVEDALFCHKCGKPQRDIGPAEPDATEPPPPPLTPAIALSAAPPTPADINFHNRIAVGIAMLCAVGAWILINVSTGLIVTALWAIPWLTVAGFSAVYLYHRRTGILLSVGKGARLGWLTGIFSFLIALVLFVVTIAIASTQGGFLTMFRAQMEAQAGPNIDEVTRALESPASVAVMLIFGLLFGFCVTVVLPVLGGALCAKVLEKE